MGLVGEASMLALGDLRSRLRLRGAGGDGGKALVVSACDGTLGAAGGIIAAAGAGMCAGAALLISPCMRTDPSLVCCARIFNETK